MQFERSTETASVSALHTASSEPSGKNPHLVRVVAMIAACLCSLLAVTTVASSAGAQSVPDNACGEFEKWERGDFNPQYVDIVLLPLKDATLPSNLDSVVKGLAGRKFQGQAEDQAIAKLVEYLKTECSGSGGTSGTAVAATANTTAPQVTAATQSATATPAPTTTSNTATPTPAPTKATPAPAATPATSLPNTGFNRASTGLAMLGGWLLLAGVALTVFNRQRN